MVQSSWQDRTDALPAFSGAPPIQKLLQTLFLSSLFLYPVAAASHTLYMIPQLLLLALALIALPQLSSTNGMLMKVGILGLAMLSSLLPIFREALAERPEFLEPAKLSINLATLAVLLWLRPVFDPAVCAKWLKRFALTWLLLVVAAYIHAQTSFWEMLLLLIQPEGVTSTRLYEIAEPLAGIFLTKNIVAMYVVAVFGAFLYFRRRAALPVTTLEKGLFFVLILSLFSRQAILSAIVLLALDYFLTAGRHSHRWAFLVVVVTALTLAGFLLFAFNFSSPEDGASTRLDLWRAFFAHWKSYSFLGLGVHQLNESLQHLDIDNYHMFFMNQIASYGIIHCAAFNLLLAIMMLRCLPRRICWLLIVPYWLNVCFQTYGYEYGNLFMFCIAANACNLQSAEPSESLDARAPSFPIPVRVS
jgi:hypothetical protein